MYQENELLPVSALQHLEFCPRQCALIHVERVWAENVYTAEGQIVHAVVDSGLCESRKNIYTARRVLIRSKEYGLTGIADMVEFHQTESSVEGTEIPGKAGRWIPVPIEYKRGRPKKHDSDNIQLCAQAVCLEEMYGIVINEGYFYYAAINKRKPLPIDERLRNLLRVKTSHLREVLYSSELPPPVYRKRCQSCSLLEICQPKKVKSFSSAQDYWSKFFRSSIDEETT